MNAIDLFYDIQKEFASRSEIMKICGCNNEEANYIFNKLDYKAKELNIHVSNNLIPMSLFLKYIGKSRVDRIKRYHECLLNFYSC